MTLFGRFREEFFKSSDEICSETISSSSNSDETSIASISFSIDVLISSVDWPVTEVSVVVVRSCNLFVEDLLVPEIDSELEDLGQDFEENFEDMEEDFDGFRPAQVFRSYLSNSPSLMTPCRFPNFLLLDFEV